MSKRKLFERVLISSLNFVLIILVYIHIPPNRIVFQSDILVSDLGSFDMQVDLPKSGWAGKPEKIYFHFNQIDSEENNNSRKDGTPKNLEIDLILTGGVLDPQGYLVTALSLNHDISLEWELLPGNFEQLPGTFQALIISSEQTSSSTISRDLIFAKEFSISVKKIGGIIYPLNRNILLMLFFVLLFLFFWIKYKK